MLTVEDLSTLMSMSMSVSSHWRTVVLWVYSHSTQALMEAVGGAGEYQLKHHRIRIGIDIDLPPRPTTQSHK
jgi:hypothetical protein